MLVHGCLMDGIIRVKSHEFGKRSRLHKRYCILKDVYVVVYKSPRSQKPLLTIPLKDVNKVEETVRACVVCCVGSVSSRCGVWRLATVQEGDGTAKQENTTMLYTT